MCFRGKFWQTMNTLPTKIITFVDIWPFPKLDDQGSVETWTLIFGSKKISYMFSWEILTDYEHISDQNNHFCSYWTFSKIKQWGLGRSHEISDLHLKDFQMGFHGTFWGTMNTFPTKIITFVDIGRSQKLNHQGSVKAQNANVCIWKNFRYVFVEYIWQTMNTFPNKIITFVGIGGSQKLDHLGSVETWTLIFGSKNFQICFRAEILIDYEHITDQNNHFRRYWTFTKTRRSGLGKSHKI